MSTYEKYKERDTHTIYYVNIITRAASHYTGKQGMVFAQYLSGDACAFVDDESTVFVCVRAIKDGEEYHYHRCPISRYVRGLCLLDIEGEGDAMGGPNPTLRQHILYVRWYDYKMTSRDEIVRRHLPHFSDHCFVLPGVRKIKIPRSFNGYGVFFKRGAVFLNDSQVFDLHDKEWLSKPLPITPDERGYGKWHAGYPEWSPSSSSPSPSPSPSSLDEEEYKKCVEPILSSYPFRKEKEKNEPICISSSEEEEEAEEDSMPTIVCAVCMDRSKSVLFEPCMHLCCCSECSDAVETCPACRAVIKTKRYVFVV